MSELFVASVSITSTRRRRFLWAAWWSEPPLEDPFRKPDAAEGGARTRQEARRQAEVAAGRPLIEIDGRWARAWARVLLGEEPFPTKARSQGASAGAGDVRSPAGAPRAAAGAVSIWQRLGVTSGATVEEIRRAFRERALVAHPDHGGDPQAFRDLRGAYEEAMSRRERGARSRGAKRPERSRPAK